MDINKHIVDQRIRKIAADNPDKFAGEKDERKKLSKAFVCLSVASCLDIELEEAFGLITEGGNDAGVDAIYIGGVNGYDFSVTVFQGKYTFDLEKENNFPANAIQRVIGSIGAIFDPSKPIEMNEDLMPKVEDIRSLIADGFIPNIKCVFTNNGLKWQQEGDTHIANAGFPENQVKFEYFNHKDIVDSLQSTKGISETLQLSGKSIQEDFNFKRVLVGKINIVALARLFEKHGDNLLDQNIRKYLGLSANRVNAGMRDTLLGEKRENFYFYNNGITMVCSKFSYNGLQADNWLVKVDDLQIINGGQSCKTILDTVKNNPSTDYSNAYVLVRLYELSGDGAGSLITDVTIATNSQNPVDLRDLRANDDLQKRLETAASELGYFYKRKKDSAASSREATVLSSSVAAESIFAVWKKKPYLAKFKKNELFGAFYHDVFDNINAAQLLIAVFIYRFCDAQRKKSDLRDRFPHIPYSSYFMSMLIGDLLLKNLELTLDKLTHKELEQAKAYFEANKDALFEQANKKLVNALNQLYPTPSSYDKIDKRRLSATFRRGDLMVYLP
ncbi:MAG: AIPR family protein [Prevotellaceae bacterium]|nr:AIPR family protein [Prevotellaceae bacterium]